MYVHARPRHLISSSTQGAFKVGPGDHKWANTPLGVSMCVRECQKPVKNKHMDLCLDTASFSSLHTVSFRKPLKIDQYWTSHPVGKLKHTHTHTQANPKFLLISEIDLSGAVSHFSINVFTGCKNYLNPLWSQINKTYTPVHLPSTPVCFS